MDNQNETLTALYQEYLTQTIQLREQLVQAQIRVKELEANQQCDICPNQGGEVPDDSETNS
ncbi:hypothetical protein GCM10009700_35210 [Brevibacterium sanguinis]|uniref:hypothetical protein n=1 Tax=Brevibacterium sanguinis TaxID=232444 RepID=UPI0031E3191B